MVKKEIFKEEFSTRLRTALLNAGVGGRGQAGRIRAALKKQGIEVTEGGIWKWLNALAIPDTTNILALSRWLEVRPEWLEYGRESALSISSSGEDSSVFAERASGTLPDEVEVPFYKDIEFACTNGAFQAQDYNGFRLRFSKDTLRRVGADKDSVLCFPVADTSMEPLIPDGTTVAINTNDKKLVDGKIYVICQAGWYRLKMLYRTGPNRVIIRSYNTSEYPDEEADLDKLDILGRLFWTSMLW